MKTPPAIPECAAIGQMIIKFGIDLSEVLCMTGILRPPPILSPALNARPDRTTPEAGQRRSPRLNPTPLLPDGHDDDGWGWRVPTPGLTVGKEMCSKLRTIPIKDGMD